LVSVSFRQKFFGPILWPVANCTDNKQSAASRQVTELKKNANKINGLQMYFFSLRNAFYCPIMCLRIVRSKIQKMLREKIKETLKDAMRAKETRRVCTLRLILAAVKDRDIALRVEDASEGDDDDLILGILDKMIKQRNESIKAYEDGGRPELAEQEAREKEIIYEFLPKQMIDGEIETACGEAVKEINAVSLKDMGKVMGVMKSRYAGAMDFSKASQIVKNLLS